ncbi:MAG: histidine--tRNA ligase [Candidatus Kerfeldbacteria bacterium RIFCSPLOWO2_12_FULL_43_9]|nr:MAG: histidine--tRNA ligase [Candidatus Kerfeldbacteria bacterium RIFCSPLOWO2_12_FULL_43_9]
MKDTLPEDQPWWEATRDQVRAFANAYSFERIDTPILESTNLFERGVGHDTDIVQKEMYSFVDQGGEHITVRPEATASVIRAYIEHGMRNKPQPVKLYYYGPMCRHERPQFGRYRQFYQCGFESLGDQHPVLDAEMILIGHRLLKTLGIAATVQLNSIGDEVCRPAYQTVLKNFFKKNRKTLCESCKRRLHKNPLRILDCKEVKCQEVAQEAPQIVDHLCDACRAHFVGTLEHLDELEILYELNPRLVRGLDYYTRTAFEYWYQHENFGDKVSLGGGGRYDKLAETLGGRHTPGVGLALGIERIVLLMRELKNYPIIGFHPDVFIAQLGEQARKKALRLFEDLRASGIKVRQFFARDGLGVQLGIASRLGAKFTLILGQKEILDQTVLVRDMETGSQEVVAYEKIVWDVQKRLK